MHPLLDPESSEDILNDALSFFGGPTAPENDSVQYGPLVLTVAPKVREPGNQSPTIKEY